MNSPSKPLLFFTLPPVMVPWERIESINFPPIFTTKLTLLYQYCPLLCGPRELLYGAGGSVDRGGVAPVPPSPSPALPSMAVAVAKVLEGEVARGGEARLVLLYHQAGVLEDLEK